MLLARTAVVDEALEAELLRTALLLVLRVADPEDACRVTWLEEACLVAWLEDACLVAVPELLLDLTAELEELLLDLVAWLEEELLLLETWLAEEDRVAWLPEEDLLRTAVPEDLLEELLDRVAWLEEEVRVAPPDVERVWATISGAATRDRAISTEAAIVIIRLIASKFLMV